MDGFDNIVQGDGSEPKPGPIRHRRGKPRMKKGDVLAEADRYLSVSVALTELASIHLANAEDLETRQKATTPSDLVKQQQIRCDLQYELELSLEASRLAQKNMDRHKWLMFRARFTRG